MASKKTKLCKYCGTPMYKNEVICHNCGGKNKPPFYERWWFIVLVIIVVVGVWNGITGNNPGNASKQSEQIEYTEVTVDELYAELENNALNAEEKYNDAYLSITGKLSSIDSDGSYISVSSLEDEWAFNSVQCFIQNEEQLDIVRGLSTGDTITVKGQIDDIGEVIGYKMNINIIE